VDENLGVSLLRTAVPEECSSRRNYGWVIGGKLKYMGGDGVNTLNGNPRPCSQRDSGVRDANRVGLGKKSDGLKP